MASAEATLKKLADKLKRVDADTAAKESGVLKALETEVAAAHRDVASTISAFRAASGEKLAALKRMQDKLQAATKDATARASAATAKEECKKVRPVRAQKTRCC